MSCEGAESKLHKCEWCPSIGVKHPAARPTRSKCGGQAPHRPDHETVSKRPSGGGASRGDNTTNPNALHSTL